MRKTLHTLACAMLAAMMMTPLAARAAEEFKPDTVSYIIMLDKNEPEPALSEDEINARAVQITYRVNKTEIRPQDKGYQSLVATMKALSMSDTYVCRMVVVQGGSSPEGPSAHNKWLSEQRAKALTDSLARYIDMSAMKVKTSTITEDYAMLYSMVKMGKDPYRSLIMKTIEDNRGHMVAMKYALRRLKGGVVWTHILKRYFTMLRSARVVLFVSEKEKPKKPQPQPEPQPEPEPVIDKSNTPDEQPVTTPVVPPAPTARDSVWVTVRQPMLAVKTNILYDLAMTVPGYGWAPTPNVTVEFYPRKGHLTFGAEVTHPGWRSDKRNKTWIIHNYLLEARYYLRGKAQFTGHYVNVYGNTGRYDIQFNADKSWLGDQLKYNWGAGLGWGWSKRLGGENSRWKVEANAAVGFLKTRFDQYHPAEDWAKEDGDFFYNWHKDPSKFVKKTKSFLWMGPTRIGISISYDIFDYPHKHVRVRKGDAK